VFREGRYCDPNEIVRQIGNMNVAAISGGRVDTVTDSTGEPTGINLPVAYGYSVVVYLDWNDTYTVQRCHNGNVKGEVREVYFDEVGEIAYQASCYRDAFGGHLSSKHKTASTGFSCKNCGAESPVGVGYKDNGPYPSADPTCQNYHVVDGEVVAGDGGEVPSHMTASKKTASNEIICYFIESDPVLGEGYLHIECATRLNLLDAVDEEGYDVVRTVTEEDIAEDYWDSNDQLAHSGEAPGYSESRLDCRLCGRKVAEIDVEYNKWDARALVTRLYASKHQSSRKTASGGIYYVQVKDETNEGYGYWANLYDADGMPLADVESIPTMAQVDSEALAYFGVERTEGWHAARGRGSDWVEADVKSTDTYADKPYYATKKKAYADEYDDYGLDVYIGDTCPECGSGTIVEDADYGDCYCAHCGAEFGDL
jgi:hypothetical protein